MLPKIVQFHDPVALFLGALSFAHIDVLSVSETSEATNPVLGIPFIFVLLLPIAFSSESKTNTTS